MHASALYAHADVRSQYQKIVQVDGVKIQVEVLDTAGIEQVRALALEVDPFRNFDIQLRSSWLFTRYT